MAIKSTYKKRESGSANFKAPAIGQPTAFRPTGKGWFNKYPNFPAKIGNANASLTNKATSPSNDELYKIWLFVNAVETGWKLAGETSQGQLGRIFYPRNLTQDQFTIEGICANQFEYDKLVTFVEHHHYSQMRPQGALAQSLDANTYPSIDFILFKPANGSTFDGFQPMHYSVVIEEIEAGAERFKNVVPYNLTCKVVFDYRQRPYHIEQDIKSRINRKRVFGAASSRATSTGNSESSSTVGANAYLTGQKKNG